MSLYRHLILKEREIILVGLNLKQTLQEMAALIGCSKATVSRKSGAIAIRRFKRKKTTRSDD